MLHINFSRTFFDLKRKVNPMILHFFKFQRLSYPDITGSPNKENSDHQPSTPKIKLKRNKTLCQNNDEWRISPVKKAPATSGIDALLT